MKQLTQAFDDMGLEYIPSKGNFICVNFEKPATQIYANLLEGGHYCAPCI